MSCHLALEEPLHNVLQLLVTANICPILLSLSILMIEVIYSFKTSVLIRARWWHIPEDVILHRLRVFEIRVQRRIFG
jgi:hypothetical protein